MNEKALIIFARQPASGKVKTRLTPALSPTRASQLYHCMLADTINRFESLEGVDRILFYTGGEDAESYFRNLWPDLRLRPQKGADLGSRIEEAFSLVFASGYRSAAIIGTDSPDLPVSFVIDAFRLLSDGNTEAVFGPAEDGGYYLLAVKRVYSDLFHEISWGSGQVLRESLEKAESMGIRVSKLPMWADVDTSEDLAGLVAREGAERAPLTMRFIEGLDLFAER